jgi:hypothetical protein
MCVDCVDFYEYFIDITHRAENKHNQLGNRSMYWLLDALGEVTNVSAQGRLEYKFKCVFPPTVTVKSKKQ